MRLTASKIRFQGTRPEQQDTVNVLVLPGPGETAALGVLTDGVGGLANGAVVSAFVNEHVSAVLSDIGKSRKIDQVNPDWLSQAAQSADQALAGHQVQQALGNSGTTLLILLSAGAVCHYLSVGDSLIYTQDSRGQLQQMNTLHTTVVEGRSVLTSAVMGTGIAMIDTGSISIDSSDTRRILLSSDGIGTFPDADLAALLHKPSDSKLRNIVNAVAAISSEHQDNLSMILFEFDPYTAMEG